ncbi:MAG TPA: hypothetical protein VK660_05790 [Xanthomonadaceae bacterium]|jgi:hypothetical protein|nr:hypothetical protein [Xanthomonadaceae bacterium]
MDAPVIPLIRLRVAVSLMPGQVVKEQCVNARRDLLRLEVFRSPFGAP